MSSPIINPIPPLTTRLTLAAKTWAFKAITTTIFSGSRIFIPSLYAKYAPTYTKTYAVRPGLECRFFIPQSHRPGQSHALYIDIHGGGFFACDVSLDDKICHYLCNTFGLVVVSLQYRLAPAYPFPVPVEDCVELILAVLGDEDLPVDRGRVAVGGQSAGGGLSMAACQDARVRERVKAIVAFYPPADFSRTFTGGYRDKPAGADGKGAVADGLRSIVPMAEWAYVPYGQDLTDPRLSPVYARAEDLPKHIYVVAAQYDKLCLEAFRMAQRLARYEAAKEEENWEVQGIRWERVKNEIHGFLENGWRTELFGNVTQPWSKEIEAVLSRVGQWLERVFEAS